MVQVGSASHALLHAKQVVSCDDGDFLFTLSPVLSEQSVVVPNLHDCNASVFSILGQVGQVTVIMRFAMYK